MRNWRKLRNYRKIKNPDGTVTHIITVFDRDVRVSAVVYKDYASIGRKMEYMEYDLKRERTLQDAKGRAILDSNGLSIRLPEREVSLDKLKAEHWDFESLEPPLDVSVVTGMEIEALYRCLNLCSADERSLLDAMYFRGLTIREYAAVAGMSKSRVCRDKAKILAKIKK